MFRILLALLVLFNSYTIAQTVPNLDLIKLEKSSDYKAADPFVLQTSTWLLSTPFRKDNTERQNALRFIGKWMQGTPDYSFVFSDVADKIGKDNADHFGVYMAAMAKYTLENKAASKDHSQVKLNSMIQLLNYCENSNNNLRMTKQLKKLAEAKEKGQLEQALQ